MSFLTPLYILGLAAISLPILFHLIRRTPKGVQPFSSLMFISPTPPRLTRRSRLDQLLLLLLRAAVISLLAFAFARPFLRLTAATDLSNVSQRLFAVLIDTSASMQRQGMWQQVEAEMERVLKELGPQDAVALYTFGARCERIVTFEESEPLNPAARRELVQQRFEQLGPGWEESSLSDAMILAADDLDAVVRSDPQAVLRQLIVISDVQQGSHVDSLQGYQWPRSVQVVFRRTESPLKGNASLAVLESTAQTEDEDRGMRVRVANSPDASQQHFEIGWADGQEQPLGQPVGVSVPAGETRVIHIPRSAPDALGTHLVLSGDQHEFDNRYYVASASRSTVSIAYAGPETGDDPEQMLYYLERAVTNDQWLNVEIVSSAPAAGTSLKDGRARLLVITQPLSDDWRTACEDYLPAGGTVLLVLSSADVAGIAEQLAGVKLDGAEDTVPDDYLMWSDIDFDSRLFRPFASPLFSDFSKIRFWKYVRVNPAAESPWRAVVRYDNGDPALLKTAVGEGTLYVLTTTWRPEDSQLARSSKFVPLLLRLVAADTSRRATGYAIGQPFPCQPTSSNDKVNVTKPDGTVVPVATGLAEFSDTDQPGIYRVQSGDAENLVAVNVARRETRTAPLDLSELEQRGVQVGAGSTYAEELAALRQMRDVELESQQGVWQWLIAAALLLVIAETVLAGRWSLQSTELAGGPSATAAGDS